MTQEENILIIISEKETKIKCELNIKLEFITR